MTCDPPAEHAHHGWHWLRHPEHGWFCAEARSGQLWTGPADLSSEAAYLAGWRYVAPAIPPGVN